MRIIAFGLRSQEEMGCGTFARRRKAAVLIGLLFALPAFCRADPPLLSPPPPTPKQAVTDTYHGVAVTEDYRWLENGDDPAVKAWSDAQNLRTRASGPRAFWPI